ncbi:LMWPc-domain-containing protein [Neocallimastix lanati (nom. inval.)]|jgi:low molecular weight phosphotyrosine protein phosphatase|uniref:LMWPc-domain-containing protein n=1 Tax=Neocallimastix californiae TaxID=1754190 RepID=A0A1Y2AJQ2_9FUNG|nr:LMWPc-domain-containing protein [Neocallimastix sp. JGI-2020a]ORY22781.1 LMWPc-domain-containing protein [Neocallimastix californiae]|eukprot:ORY22781.1 LMWPc-domain-containing protein [Neocallimastix californiae]
MSEGKISVLFVCLGNICRSPMAEAVFTHEVNKRNLSNKFNIDSCGTCGYHVGQSPDSRSSKTCRKHKVPVNHTARQIRQNDFNRFDYILCMDESNLEDLRDIAPKKLKNKIQLFGEYDPQGERIIKDPYYSGIDGFEHNFEQVTRCSEGLLKHLGF